MKIIRKQLWLLMLIAGITAPALSQDAVGISFAVHKIAENDVLTAKTVLEQTFRRNKLLKRVIISSAIGITGLALFKIAPGIGEYLKFKADHDQVKQNAQAFADISKDSQVTLNQALMAKITEYEKQISRANRSWTSLTAWKNWGQELLGGVPTVAGMIVLPAVGESLYEKTKHIFSKQSLVYLVKHQLEMANHFDALDRGLIQYAPQEFANNLNYKNKQQLVLDAQRLIMHFAKLPTQQLREIKQEAQIFIAEQCNLLVKQMSYVIAYMRYLEKHDKNQVLINNFADQLFQATYEFALQAQVSLNAKDDAGLFNAIASLYGAFNSTVNNFVIFTR